MSLSSTELDAIYLTIALASVTTLWLMVLGTPLAWWLSRRSGTIPALLEALVALPLILPPTVLGFYLLLMFAPDSFVGHWWQQLTGEPLAFTFTALVIGS
ncbi:MAG: molybdate ABC transporter permease subunit, partial [Halioglobus sp.]